MVAKVLTGRVVFTPRATGAEWAVEYAAECSLGKLVNGLLGPKAVVAPTGFETFGNSPNPRNRAGCLTWAAHRRQCVASTGKPPVPHRPVLGRTHG